ncbi:MAG: hypothetical protein WBN17_08430 [Aureibaculum sp.]
MKKIVAIISLCLLGVISMAQKNEIQQQYVKYVTEAPDGSIAMTIIDYTNEDRMTVESAEVFYKYQILDQITSESIYTSKNKSKDCVIDKTKLANGTYDLKLYTSDFVITTDLEILRMGESYAALKHEMEKALTVATKGYALAENGL